MVLVNTLFLEEIESKSLFAPWVLGKSPKKLWYKFGAIHLFTSHNLKIAITSLLTFYWHVKVII